ncbi:MAG: PIN domain-containing protein [Acidobacteriaceae bacterium]
MKRVVLADAGPLYAAIDPDDRYHTQSQQELLRLARNKREVLVTWPTLLETYTLVLYRLGNAAASRWLSNILEYAIVVNPIAEDYRTALKVTSGFTDQPITLFDATVAAIAMRLKIEVWTYDHHFDVMRVPVWR